MSLDDPNRAPPSEVDPVQIEEVLRALAAALRSYRLYEGSNPMLDRFVAAVRAKFTTLWEQMPRLRLEIEEDRIRWEGHHVFPTGESGSDLPFIFYKDGIRELTILPGFEERDVVALLGVLARAPSVRQEEDDLLTLLWQEDLTKLRYTVVEAAIDGPEAAPGPGTPPSPIDSAAVRNEDAPQAISTEDFQETIHFLDEAELRKLREEVERENGRDLWRDVLNALLDRLEDGDEDRQLRIVGILAELLPSSLASGQFDRATSLLEGLIALATRGTVLRPPVLRVARQLFDLLGQEETIFQLAEILEEMPDRLSDDSVLRLLGFFPPRSIGPLMRAVDRVERPGVRRAFEVCVQRLAESNRDEVVGLLSSPDPAVVGGALRWIGRLEIGSAVSEVVRFLRHGDASVRLAAVDALVSVRAAAAGNSLIPLLDDENRDVRIAAARALGALAYVAARQPLESAIGSKRLRDADRSEKLAFFEAFGRVSGPEGIPVLSRILNSRSWLGRGEPSEIRACAAQALARIRHPSAREALNAAANDADPLVRAAVTRAVRGESGGG